MVVSWSVYLKAEHESAVRFIESIEKYCPSPNIWGTNSGCILCNNFTKDEYIEVLVYFNSSKRLLASLQYIRPVFF